MSNNTNANLEQRVRDCDTYHMAFDSVARTFHTDTTTALYTGGVTAFEEVFDKIDDAKREQLLREMYASLDPEEKLRFIVHLTGNVAIKEFLRGIAEDEEAYDQALAQLSVEAEARNYITPQHIPKDAMVDIFMADRQRVEQFEPTEEEPILGYQRALKLRSLGNGRFKVVSENFVEGYESGVEDFDVNQVVQFGTPIEQGSNTVLEPVCRLNETLGIKRGKKIWTLELWAPHNSTDSTADRTMDLLDAVVYAIAIDDDTILS